MKKSLSCCLRSILLSVAFIMVSNGSYANHILGMDLNYSYVSGNTYTISLIAYGDCGNSSFVDLSSGVPTICIYDGATYVGSITLTLQAPTTGLFTTPVCLSDTDSTTCTSLSYTIPGIKKFVYSGNYTLSGTSHAWRFIFLGDMLTAFGGRSTNITNIIFTGFAGSSVIDMEDTLDNTYHSNNSNPVLNALPNPYYCLNVPNNYNPNGVDPDGDSLSYFLVDGKMGNYPTASCVIPGGTAPWTGTAWTGQPITDTTPLQVATGSYSFSHATGDINFTPNFNQRSLVVYNIEEYRNDTFIGTSQREMSVLVQSCTTSPPTGTITSSTGSGVIADSVDYLICAGTGSFSFTITPAETDTFNNIYVSAVSLPPGATFTVTADSTHHPSAVFSWTSTGITPGTYTFYVIFTDNNCPVIGTQLVAFHVIITGTPVLSGAGSVCVGATATLTAVPAGGTWSSLSTGIATIGSGSGIVTGVSSGTSVISYNIGSGCGAATTETVNPAPNPISGIPSVCVGFTQTLTDATVGGTWSSSNTAISTVGVGTGIVTGIAAGVDTISYTKGGCSASVSFTVYANPLAITGASTLCNGTTTTLHDASLGGTWSSSNTAIATVGATTGIVTGVSVGCVTISYSVGSCYVIMPVCVTTSPAIILGPSGLCLGATITLTDATAGGSWTSSSPTIASVGPSTGVVTGLAVGTAIISYTVGGCPALKSITVNPLPGIITGLGNVCVGQTGALFDPGGGTWTSSNTAIATVGSSTGIVTGVAAGSVTITYTLSTGCYTTFAMVVYAVPGPITGTTTVCVAATAALSDTSSGGIWTSSNIIIAAVDPGTGVVTGISSGTAIITYTVGSGCFSVITVTVDPPPVGITGTTSLCAGTTTALFDGTLGGLWSSSSTAIATIGSLSGILTGVSGGIAAISYTLATGCYAVTFVTVNPKPAAIGGPTALCIGLTGFLTDANPGGAYTSSAPGTVSVVPATGLITGISVGIATITYTLPTGCYNTISVTVNSSPGPISGPNNVCIGTCVTETDAVGGGTWSSSSPAIVTIGSSSGSMCGIAAGTTATITYSLGVGCYATLPVTVNPLPAAIGGPSVVCIASAITLTDPGGGTWVSTTPAVATIGPSSGVLLGVSTGTSLISYTLATGCYRTKTVTVDPLPALFTVTGGGAYCAGGTGVHIGLSGSAIGVNYQLFSGITPVSGLIAGTGSSLDFGLETAAGTYTVTATIVATGCSRTMTGSVVIIINPLPPLCTVSGGGAYCAGGAGLHIGLSCSSIGINYQLMNGVLIVGSPLPGTGGALDFGLQTAAGTYTVVATNATTGCSRAMTGSQTISINPLPSPIGGPSALCVGATIILTSSPGAGIWTISPATVAIINPGTGAVTGVSTGIATVTYTLPTTTCFASTTVTVSVSPGPITGPTGACVGETVTLTDSIPGGAWSSSTPSVATVGSLSGIVTGVTTGVTVITYSLGTGCTRVITFTVGPAPPGITGASSVCVGSTITLSDLTGGGVWSSSALPVATVSGTGIVSGISAGTATISYTVAGCSVLKPITVNPLPAAIGGPSTVCRGTTITLTDGVGGGVWSTTSVTITIGGFTGIVTGISPGPALVTYTIGTCAVTKTLTVNSTAAITGTLGICVGATTTLSDATAGGTWSSGTSTVATIVATSGLVTGIAPGTSVITYTIPGGCTVTATVTVNNAPTPIGGTLTVCVAATTALSDGAGGGTWSSGSTTIASVTGVTGIVTGVAPGTSVITYSLGGLCVVTAVVTVNPIPAAIGGTTHACVGNTTTLTDGTAGGAWSDPAYTAIATVGSSSGIVTGIAPGVAVVTYSLSTGCARTASVTINPVPVSITGIATVCAGNTTSLGDATPGGTWSSGTTSVATITATTGVVTGVTPGTSLITYSIGGCTATTTVTVTPAPTPITGTLNVCVGLTTTLSDGISGGTWTSSIPSIATVGSGSGIVTGVSSGTVVIFYRIGTGCAQFAAVIVNPISAILGTPVVCIGQTTHLTDTTLGGSWSSAAPGIATVNPAGIVTGVSAGTATINYTLPSGCTTSISVTVNPLPSAITGPSTVCIGQTITLVDTSPLGVWSSSNPAAATVDAFGVVTGITSGSTTISYTYVGSTGCAATANVTVNPLPAPIAGANEVCAGYTITLTDIGGGTWSSAPTTVATIAPTTGVVSGVSPGTATITYTLGTGCAATKTVTVVGIPAAPTASPSLSICQGQSTTFTDLAGPGTWTSSSPSVATIGATTGVASGRLPGITVITFSIGSGCTAPTVVLTVNSLPAGISGTTNLCVGNTTTYTDVFPGGSWGSSDTTVATISSGGLVTAIAPGTAIITYTTAAGCSTSLPLTVGSAPMPITGLNTICIGTTTTLADATPGGTWSSSAPATAPVDPFGDVSGIALGTAIISYSTGTICPATKTVTVTPFPSAIAGSTNVCVGSTTALSDVVGGGIWTSSNGAIATVGSSSGIVTGASAGPVTIIYTLGASCTVTINLTVNPLPSPITGPNNVCQFQSITLSDATPGGTWSSSSPAIGSVDPTGDVVGISAGVTTISYTDGLDCSATSPVTVNAAPSAITGNTNVCLHGTSTLSDTVTGGTWTSFNTAVATIGSGTGIVTGVSLGNATILYQLPGNCFVTTIVNVYPLPTAYGVTGGGSYCAGDTGVHIGLTNSAIGVNYMLYHGSTAVGSFPGTGTALDLGLSTVAGTYTVIGTSTATGCSIAMTGSAVVIIKPSVVPSLSLRVNPNDSVCSGTATTFTPVLVNAGSAPSYYWTVNSFPVALTTTYTFIPSNGDVVKVAVTSDTACAMPRIISDSIVMTVMPYASPAVSVFANPGDTVCSGIPVTLNAIPAYGGPTPGYAWLRNGAPSGSGVSYTFIPNNGDVLYCIMTSSYPCRLNNRDTSFPVVMTVDNVVLPVVSIAANPGTIIGIGQSDTLTASVTNATAPTYQWYINGIPVTGATTNTYVGASFSYPHDDSVSCVVTSHGVCEVISHQWVYITVTSVGVTQLTTGNSDISVLPNPNKGEFVVKGTLGTLTDEDVSLEITDMIGQVVYKNKITAKNGKLNERIQLSSKLANGMYMLTLRSGSDNKVFHIVIEQ